MRGLVQIVLLFGCAGLCAAGSCAAQVTGRVALSAQGKPLRTEAAAEAVVYFRPATPVPVKPAADAVDMRTERKQFVPGALPVTVGTTVRFPNMDPILHNVFSTGSRSRFDLGLLAAGEAQSHTFDQAGLVRVYCNVHHEMIGHILVLDTPYFSRPAADGSFTLDVPPGTRGELFAWHERTALWRRKLESPTAEVTIELEVSRPRVPRHMNKFGKPYGSDRRRGY